MSGQISPDEMTLDELQVALAPAVAESAIFDGWTNDAVRSAAQGLGADTDVALLAYPNGPMDMISAWFEAMDAQMIAEFPPEIMVRMKIRERIGSLVQFRLDAMTGMEEALRRAQAILAMPKNARQALKLGWRSADRMWRLAGDVSTDYNYYTKRTILASIYTATLAVFVNDESEGKAETRAFLDRRIEGVMRFEKAKAKWLGKEREGFSVARFLGRLRYPAR